ncbi:YebC/PmpR family DNA-binding transcriptional regulator [Peptoniphilus sp. GNH]|nr:DNA-binding regulatory protein, YebC/PmpR family [Clostridiales bacterium KA00134]UHR02695.1 YebC/PmpR family DNA-binding transcriptional regulator [Peptoniphilus sp. GNH]
MSGHSKWNNIKNKKGKEDAKRGRIFTKLGRYIMVAARDGGPDPDYNPSLKAAIDKAKAENMPNDNIERAIKKGNGELGDSNFEEVTYEGYGPGGVAVIVECLTDNRNRTAPDVRHAFDKFGGNLGTSGSVTFMFEKKGQIGIEKSDSIDGDELMMLALELGAEDVIEREEAYEILTKQEDYSSVRDGLEKEGYDFIVSEVAYLPSTMAEINDEEIIAKLDKMIDMLEDNDDVQEVYTNWERD